MHSVEMVKNEGKSRSPRRGLSERAERAFERISVAFLVLLSTALAYSIAEARATGDKVNPLSTITTGESAPNVTHKSHAVPTAADPVTVDRPTVADSLMGESGKLRAQIYEAGTQPGILKAAVAISDALEPLLVDFHIITPRPATDKRKGRIGLYYLGNWPSARKTKGGAVDYSPPSGFIEVTPANQAINLSEHFHLRDFLTKGQNQVWPKYLVVNLKLVDKLELILNDLQSRGINPSGVHVMSGFRTPQYNASGGDPRGRASLSRHMYGDAADVFIDNTGNGWMDDLNGDGRVNIKDAQVIAQAAKRVEQAHPSLVGGIGVYPGTSSHGPFVHIDTRGYPARW